MASHTAHPVANTTCDSHGKKGMEKIDEEAPDSGLTDLMEESAEALENEIGPKTGNEIHGMEIAFVVLFVV